MRVVAMGIAMDGIHCAVRTGRSQHPRSCDGSLPRPCELVAAVAVVPRCSVLCAATSFGRNAIERPERHVECAWKRHQFKRCLASFSCRNCHGLTATCTGRCKGEGCLRQGIGVPRHRELPRLLDATVRPLVCFLRDAQARVEERCAGRATAASAWAPRCAAMEPPSLPRVVRCGENSANGSHFPERS